MQRVAIIGCGGHAKVIMDIIFKNKKEGNNIDIFGFYDDNSYKKQIYGTPVLGTIKDIRRDMKTNKNIKIIVGIGDNKTRKKIVDKISDNENKYISLIHPSSTIANEVKIGKGTIVVAGSVINIGTTIGNHCIINTCASVGHDVTIGNFVHISPGVRLTGDVKIYDNVHLGAGSVVIPGIKIGQNSVIGAGAVVTKDVPANCTVVGVPAKPIRFH